MEKETYKSRENLSEGQCEYVGDGHWLKRNACYFYNAPPSRYTIAYERWLPVDCIADKEVEQAVREWEKARDAFLTGGEIR